MYNYRHEFYEYQRNRESLHRYINTCTNTNWYLVTCQGWGTKTVVVGACVVCTHAQSDPENKLHKTKFLKIATLMQHGKVDHHRIRKTNMSCIFS